MNDAIRKLTDEQLKFIEQELGFDKAALLDMSDDELYNKVYDVMCDIECAETPTDDTPITEHCKMAADIVTILGEAL